MSLLYPKPLAPQASLHLERGAELCIEHEIQVFIKVKHFIGKRAIEMMFYLRKEEVRTQK